MTAPPLPASPCLRVRLDYTQGDGLKGGSRFYLTYAGSAPSASNCVTIAGDIAAAWNTNLAPLINEAWALTEIDVLDIATDSGASGVWTGSDSGSRSGSGFAAAVATNIEFEIARRYRGGKPRMFMPPGVITDELDSSHFNTAYVSAAQTGIVAFFTAVQAISVGAVGALSHVNLSYYKGFTNIPNSSGRERAVPTYRDTALVDSVTGYVVKALMGSQRRRRTATAY